MKRLIGLFFLTISVTVAMQSASAQEEKRTVSGTVTDLRDGEPVAGASVVEKGTANGVFTDANGSYTIRLSGRGVLEISFMGYKTKEIPVGDETVIHVRLEEKVVGLSEVVVVGYGTQRRRELTGAIASVSKSHLEYNVAPSVDGLLSGAIAGVNVTQASGQPGAAASIRIRGGNSVNAGNDPLYVIDGFIFYSDKSSTQTGLGAIESEINPLTLLNPSDIESIEILKDVSATAIYGSRGSNGVIIVTTKKGSRGETSLNYQYSAGFSRPSKKIDLLSSPQWARIQKDYFNNKGQYTDEEIPSLTTYNWQDAVLQTGTEQTHELSLGGGDETSRYFISGNYLKQEGIILHSSFNRFAGRVNFDKKILQTVTVGINATASKSTQNTLTTFEEVNYNDSPFSHGIANSLTYALYIPPVVPIYGGGTYNYNNPFEYAYLKAGDRTANPVSDLENSSAQNIHTVFLGSAYLQISPLEGLTAKVNLGGNLSHTTQNYFAPSYTAIGLAFDGVGGVGNKQQQSILAEYTLSYNKTVNDRHSFDVLAGYTQETAKTNFASGSSSKFTIETLGFNNLQDGEDYLPPVTGTSGSDLYSLLGRVNYSFLSRYNLTVNFRSDYSTRLAEKHRRKNFPSVGLSWNINDEPFLRDTKVGHALSVLKLRLSGGTVGNQEGIGEYEFLQTLTAARYGGGTIYIINNSGNEDLRWESTAQYNIGLDAGLWNSRLAVTADVYYKKTSDLLLRIPPKLGESHFQLVNAGNVTNRGVELGVNATLIDRHRLRWTVAANGARNINRITALYEDVKELTVNDVEIMKTGEPFGLFYGLQFDGVVQKDEDVSKLPTSPSYSILQPGDPKFRDINGDNHIDISDRTALGSRQPKFTYGLANTLNYGPFDLHISLQGTQGNKIYNHLRRYLEHPTDCYNMSAALLDAWTPDNPSNTVPRITDSPLTSLVDSRYIEDGSYLRLKLLTAGYKLPALKHLELRIFATAQNLFTLARYKGYDPEIANGTDLGTYPMSRTFFLGVRAGFK
jgi:TonB-linked SusC/RagA family outer membrane protein